MTKGIAVYSGSVAVHKILENGLVDFSGSVGITGSLTSSNITINTIGNVAEPTIQFFGSGSTDPIELKVISGSTLSWEGTEGQLFSITNNLTSGTIFSVGDVSGMPLLEADADGTVSMARFGTKVGVGTNNPTSVLTVSGTFTVTGSSLLNSVSGTNATFVSITGSGGGITNLTASNINNFTNDVRAQFSAGANIGIANGVISVTGSVPASVSAGGVDYSVQFNSGSLLSGSSNLIYNYNTNVLSGTIAQFTTVTASNLVAGGVKYPTADGDTGQILVTDGVGNLSFQEITTTIRVRNLESTEIVKGTPLYVTASGTSGNIAGVYRADAGNDNRMPAACVANENIASDAEGLAILSGFINGVNTTLFDSGDAVYVAVGGGYTNVRPTGSALVQPLGYVEKSAVNGSGVVQGPNHFWDLPNITAGHFWVGASNGVPTTVASSSFAKLAENNVFTGTNTFQDLTASTGLVSVLTASNIYSSNSIRTDGVIQQSGSVDNYMLGRLAVGKSTLQWSPLQMDVNGQIQATAFKTNYSLSLGIESGYLRIGSRNTTGAASQIQGNILAKTLTSGILTDVNFTEGGAFAPTSGNAQFNSISINHTINQTGTASGITRGLVIDPALTSATDYRGLELKQNSHWAIYQSGSSARNYFAGDITASNVQITNLDVDTITAREYYTELVSSSIIYESGSTKFGDTSDDIHQFSGSIQQSGSTNPNYFLGSLAVGDINPSTYKLYVNGTSRFTDSIVSSGPLYANDHLYLAANKYIRSIDSIRIDIDTDNNQTDRVFVVSTNNAATELFRIQENGNVGIGTTSPTHKVHINSTTNNAYALRVQGNTTNVNGAWTGIGISGENANTKAAILFEDIGVSYSRGKLHLAVNNELNQNSATPSNAKLTISNDGNVGIGTTSPSSSLEIQSSTNQLTLTSIATSGITQPELIFRQKVDDGTYPKVGRIYARPMDRGSGSYYSRTILAANTRGSETLVDRISVQNRNSDYDVAFLTGSGGEAMRVHYNGNIGIGAIEPQDALSIQVPTGTTKGIFFQDGSTTNFGTKLKYNETDNKFFIEQLENGSQTGILTILRSNGNVGIGTSSPTSPLHIVETGGSTGSINVGLIVDYEATGAELVGAGTAILFRGKSGGGGISNYDQAQISTHNYGTNNAHGISFYTKPNASTSLTEYVRISNAGYLGVGTTNPVELLDVRTATATAGQGARIGEAKIGTWEGGTDYAAFTHNTLHGTSNSYALLQRYQGETFLNSAAGQPLWFRQGNSTNMVITSTGNLAIGKTTANSKFDLLGNATISGTLNMSGSIIPDGDGVHEIGSASNRFADVYAVQTTVGAVFETGLTTPGIEEHPTGTVLVWRQGKLRPCDKEEDVMVMGIGKHGKQQPIILGAEPVLVTGKVEEGDWIVTSNKVGHGKALKKRWWKRNLTGKIIAQALESCEGESNLIKCMINKT